MSTTIQTGIPGSLGLPSVAGSGHAPPTHVAASDVPAAQPPAKAKTAEVPGTQQLKDAISQANKGLANSSSNQLLFSIDKATGMDVVKLVDQQTGKTIRQYPSQQMLEIAQSLEHVNGGALLKQEA